MTSSIDTSRGQHGSLLSTTFVQRGGRVGRLSVVTAGTLAFASGIAIGLAAGIGPTEPVYAACGNLITVCTMQDDWHTSGVTVYHYDDQGLPGLKEVEPDDTDTWLVTANYSIALVGGGCSCEDYPAQATVTVTWTGSTWTATCTSGCNGTSGPIYDVDVCAVAGCLSPAVGTAYELIVKVANVREEECQDNDAHLVSVDYETTELDDGDTIDSCAEVAAVSPISQTWSDTDSGPFGSSRCTWNCAGVSGGATVNIIYD